MSGRSRPNKLLSVNWPSASRKLSINSDEDGRSIKAKANAKNGTTPSQAHENWRVGTAGAAGGLGTLLIIGIAFLPPPPPLERPPPPPTPRPLKATRPPHRPPTPTTDPLTAPNTSP